MAAPGAHSGDGVTGCDMLLVGGGLANSLIALTARRTRAELKVVMLERRRGLDDQHTWCLFRSDVPAHSWAVLEPMFEGHWPGYTVAFQGYRRSLTTPYACLTGPSLSRAAASALGKGLIEGAEVVEIGEGGARLSDGRRFAAPLVLDGRGASPTTAMRFAWQKFVGLELRLEHPHGLALPVVMDAAVRQIGGFRFFYVLPLDADRLLIEDTRYSDDADLDVAALESEVRQYARQRGWIVAEIRRREAGVLPITLSGDIRAFLAEGGLPRTGLRGGFFHPTTGYSLARAAEIAEALVAEPRLDTASIAESLRRRSMTDWRSDAFYRALNRMLFHAAAPAQRCSLLERFYRLPQPLIERFYARRLTWVDKARILIGRPPVPILRALAAVRNGSGVDHA